MQQQRQQQKPENRERCVLSDPQSKEKLTDLSLRCKYLIATGYADEAGNIARLLATLAYDRFMDRCVDEYTGGVYFYEWEER